MQAVPPESIMLLSSIVCSSGSLRRIASPANKNGTLCKKEKTSIAKQKCGLAALTHTC